MNGFDFDGVISIGIHPGPYDVIITGRTLEEKEHVQDILKSRGIDCPIYFNPVTLEFRGTGTDHSRRCSGKHKGHTLLSFKLKNNPIDVFFEDDEVQIEEILKLVPDQKIAHIVSDLVIK